MIYRLEVENFFSIRDQQVLDLTIAPNVSDPDGRYAPIFLGSDLRAPKVIAFYGANASGKTNLLKALEFAVGVLRDSAQRAAPGFPCERFNDQASCSRPIRIAVELGGIMDLSQDALDRARAGEAVEYGVYRYELSNDVEDGVATKVASEALRQKPSGHGKWQRVFERDGQGQVKGSKFFSLTGFHHLLNTLRPNVSVLSSFALFEHPAAKLWIDIARKAWFQFGGSGAGQDKPVIDFLASHPNLLDELNKELSRIDVGVESMRLEQTVNGPEPRFRHAGLQVEMPWLLESHGTRSFIRMFPALAVTLSQGGVCVIDEFDASIHPLVLPEIMRWFYAKPKNAYDAQLWFSCHSVSLLDDLTKEEIVICEKDREGRTTAHSLMDIKVRRDENLYRKYLSGAYGGILHIG